jgi:hypothetical protein
MRHIIELVGGSTAESTRRLRATSILGPLILVLASVSATVFLSVAIIGVVVIWLPVALLSFAFGVRKSSGHAAARPDPAAA